MTQFHICLLSLQNFEVHSFWAPTYKILETHFGRTSPYFQVQEEAYPLNPGDIHLFLFVMVDKFHSKLVRPNYFWLLEALF